MSVINSLFGSDFTGWTTVIGDGNYNPPGVSPVDTNDILCENEGARSVLSANVLHRKIMAHNITYYKVTDEIAMSCNHYAKYAFRLPYVISTGNTDFNGQTVEGGLFIWDGADTQLDYGLAFQWVINPWDPDYKKVRYWNGSAWINLTTLEPDTGFHTIEFTLDIQNQVAHLSIDGITYAQNVFSATPKTGWSNIVEARFQAETISIYPPPIAPFPEQRVVFKDWKWEWTTPVS